MKNSFVEHDITGWRPEDSMDSVKKPLPIPIHNHITHTLVSEKSSISQPPQEVLDIFSSRIDHGPY